MNEADHLLAYVGPGPGLTAAWAFFALLGTIALAVLSLLIWPIRIMIRKMRANSAAPKPDDATKPSDAPGDPNNPGHAAPH
jgi:hypothetical protein